MLCFNNLSEGFWFTHPHFDYSCSNEHIKWWHPDWTQMQKRCCFDKCYQLHNVHNCGFIHCICYWTLEEVKIVDWRLFGSCAHTVTIYLAISYLIKIIIAQHLLAISDHNFSDIIHRGIMKTFHQFIICGILCISLVEATSETSEVEESSGDRKAKLLCEYILVYFMDFEEFCKSLHCTYLNLV